LALVCMHVECAGSHNICLEVLVDTCSEAFRL
jgi:hypothetical protein